MKRWATGVLPRSFLVVAAVLAASLAASVKPVTCKMARMSVVIRVNMAIQMVGQPALR
jgi:hypothetical protein